jgi:hypothetical protein
VIRTFMANEFKDHRKLRVKWREQGNALIEDAKVTAKFRVCSRLPVNSCDRTSARPDDVIGQKRCKVRIAVMQEQSSFGRPRRRFPGLGRQHSSRTRRSPSIATTCGNEARKDCRAAAHVSMLRRYYPSHSLLCKVRSYCASAAIHPCNCIQSPMSVGVTVSSCSAGASPSPMCVP